MKARIIEKTIREKITDWLASLPLEVAEKVKGKIVVTGGCIASMFLKEPVSDYDMYFKDIKTAIIVSQYYCQKWIKDKFGFIDDKGDLVIIPKYTKIGEFGKYRKGWAKVCVDNKKFGFINENGREIVPPIYDSVESFKK